MKYVPIIGSPWYLYSDESGGKDPNEQLLLCFAIIAVPGDKEYMFGGRKIQFPKIGKIADLPRLKEISTKYSLDICITYANFRDREKAKIAIDNYHSKMKNSMLPVDKIPTLSNFNWAMFYGASIASAIGKMLKRGNHINTVYIRYHKYEMKPRETAIVENLIRNDFVEKIRSVCIKINSTAGYTHFRGQDITVEDIAGIDDKVYGVRLAHEIINLFRREYEHHGESANTKFLNALGNENFHIDNMETVFKSC